MTNRGDQPFQPEASSRAAYDQWQAPQRNQEVLLSPDWELLGDIALHQHRDIASTPKEQMGNSIASLIAEARLELLQQALQSENSPREALEPLLHRGGSTLRPIIMSGHQPTLFHPGVWYKNFILRRLAKQIGGIAINLIIDSDLCRAPAVTIPAGPIDSPKSASILFDDAMTALPWEERGACNHQTCKSFPTRLSTTLPSVIEQPIVDLMWNDVTSALESTGNLGLAIAQGRHQLENHWIADHTHQFAPSYEIPISQLTKTRSFRRLAAAILLRIAEFHQVHNLALVNYRKAHRIRNHAHPVPNLTQNDDWWEAPFWIWSKEDPRRQPLFVAPSPAGLRLSTPDGDTWQLRAAGVDSVDQIVEEWNDLEQRGIKIRSRALVTTTMARLLWCDLFIHGIGGAKYDQVTDQILRSFFDVKPPRYAVVSATLKLPIDSHSTTEQSPSDCRHMLRRIRFHPETLLSQSIIEEGDDRLRSAIEAKREWITKNVSRDELAQRHREIEEANHTMLNHLQSDRKAWQRRLNESLARERAQRILGSREVPFCAFPEATIRPFMLAPLSGDAQPA